MDNGTGLIALALAGTWLLAGSAVQADDPICPGDHNGNGQVEIDELLTSVGHSLNGCPAAATCPGDHNDNGKVEVHEVVTSVGHSLNGCPAHFIDNGDGTMTNSHTGEMWDKKDNAEGIHDKDQKYTWSANATAADGTAFTVFLDTLNHSCDGDESTSCTHDSDCTGIGNGKCGHAGYRDWRLPSVNRDGGALELDSLIDPTQTGDNKIFPAFKTPCSTEKCTVTACSCNGSDGWYWSSTTYATYPLGVWYVDFSSSLMSYDRRTNGNYVRAVRGLLYTPTPTHTPTPLPTDTPTATPTPTGILTAIPTPTCVPGFTDNGDGTIANCDHFLMWEQKVDDVSTIHYVDNAYNWSINSQWGQTGTLFTGFLDTLNNKCDGDESTSCTKDSDCKGIGNGRCGHAGYRDWRLGTFAEMALMLEPTVPLGLPGGPVSAYFLPNNGLCWLSDTDPSDPKQAKLMEFASSEGDIVLVLKTIAEAVRAVRNCSQNACRPVYGAMTNSPNALLRGLRPASPD